MTTRECRLRRLAAVRALQHRMREAVVMRAQGDLRLAMQSAELVQTMRITARADAAQAMQDCDSVARMLAESEAAWAGKQEPLWRRVADQHSEAVRDATTRLRDASRQLEQAYGMLRHARSAALAAEERIAQLRSDDRYAADLHRRIGTRANGQLIEE